MPDTIRGMPPAALPNSRMRLDAVRPTRKVRPQRTVIYGIESIGKSSMAATAPSPIFIAAEEGLSEIEAQAFPEPKTMDEVYEALAFLATAKHEYKTLVVDTLDWMEPLLTDRLCKRNGWDTIESPGYGKGHAALPDEWRIFLSRLDDLRRTKEMEIILLAHCAIKPFGNPTGHDYSRYELNLHKNAAPLIRQWADCVLFLAYDDRAVAVGEGKRSKVKGVSSGNRVIHTEHTAAFDAKNRYGLPPELPLDTWTEFARARAKGLAIDVDEVFAASKELVARLKMDEGALVYLETIKTQPHDLLLAYNRLKVKAVEAGLE